MENKKEFKCEFCNDTRPHLCYAPRKFDIECEHCKKTMIFYEKQLTITGGDAWSGYNANYDCEHCGKINKWQGFM